MKLFEIKSIEIFQTIPKIKIKDLKGFELEKKYLNASILPTILLIGIENQTVVFYSNYKFHGGFSDVSKVIVDYLSTILEIKNYTYCVISEHLGCVNFIIA